MRLLTILAIFASNALGAMFKKQQPPPSGLSWPAKLWRLALVGGGLYAVNHYGAPIVREGLKAVGQSTKKDKETPPAKLCISATDCMTLGLQASSAHDYLKAVEAFNAGLEIDRTEDQFRISLEIAHTLMGDFSGAAKDLGDFLAFHPNGKQTNGLDYVDLGDFPGHYANHVSTLSNWSDYFAWEGLSNCYLNLPNASACLSEVRMDFMMVPAVKPDPNASFPEALGKCEDAADYVNLAMDYHEAGQYRNAADVLRVGVGRNRADPELRLLLVVEYTNQGKFPRALGALLELASHREITQGNASLVLKRFPEKFAQMLTQDSFKAIVLPKAKISVATNSANGGGHSQLGGGALPTVNGDTGKSEEVQVSVEGSSVHLLDGGGSGSLSLSAETPTTVQAHKIEVKETDVQQTSVELVAVHARINARWEQLGTCLQQPSDWKAIRTCLTVLRMTFMTQPASETGTPGSASCSGSDCLTVGMENHAVGSVKAAIWAFSKVTGAEALLLTTFKHTHANNFVGALGDYQQLLDRLKLLSPPAEVEVVDVKAGSTHSTSADSTALLHAKPTDLSNAGSTLSTNGDSAVLPNPDSTLSTNADAAAQAKSKALAENQKTLADEVELIGLFNTMYSDMVAQRANYWKSLAKCFKKLDSADFASADMATADMASAVICGNAVRVEFMIATVVGK